MKNQYLLSLATFATVTLGTISIVSKPAIASDAEFECLLNQETPTTVVKTSNGAEQPIFHWNLNEESVSKTPEELCNSVTQKLNNYIAEGNDLSSLTFNASNFFGDDLDAGNFPAVCISSETEPCKLALFTLKPSEDPRIASAALDSILDPALQSTAVKPKSQDRGFQSTSYKVNFWDLLGL